MNEMTVEQRSQPAPGSGDVQTPVAATGGLLGATGAASCCLLPLALVSLGFGGAWTGQLTALMPYQPVFYAISIGFLGYGYWLIHARSRKTCACARPAPGRPVRLVLWLASALVAMTAIWPYAASLIL